MAKKRFFPALLLTLVLALSLTVLSAFAESGAYAVKFYPGDYGTMTKNDQIPFVYYGIDDDVNKPYYYKLNVSETDTFGFVGSIIDTLLPNSGYEFAYWTANAAVYQVGSDTAIPAGTALSSDQIQNSVTVNGNAVTTVPATDGYLSLPNVKTITPTGQITPPATGGYYYSPSAGGSSASPKTTDPGVALYAAAALLSTAGLAWNGRRCGQ